MENVKIFITEGDVVGNKGAVAMVKSIINGILEKYPNAEITVTSKFIKSGYYERESFPKVKILYDSDQTFDIPLVRVWVWWLLKKLGIKLDALLDNNVIQTYLEADIVVSSAGISFTDEFGMIKIYHFSKYVQIPLLLNKKIIKFTQSFGPFHSRYNRMIAKMLLPQVNILMARGEQSYNNLLSLGIKDNIIQLPDIVLTMEKLKSEKAEKCLSKIGEGTIIGLAPNIVCKRLSQNNQYEEVLTKLCEYILEKHQDVKILLLPHTIEASSQGNNDDMSICQYISKQINNENRVFIENLIDYEPEEIKWLISNLDFFIGSRFHSLIEAVSAYVPSIAIGWNSKYNEMMDWVKLEENVIQIEDLTLEKIINMFNVHFSDRLTMKQRLHDTVPEIKKEAQKAIDITIGFLDEKN